MKIKIAIIVVGALLTFMPSVGQDSAAPSDPEKGPNEEKEPTGKNNVAYQWGYMALEGTANDTDRFKPRPTITSRYLGLIFTSMFDAWTRYFDS